MIKTHDMSLPERIKAETWELHEKAEHHTFQDALVKGAVTREGYVAWLGQMLMIHKALESRLRNLVAANPAVATIVEDYQYQEGYLREDLTHFGVDPDTVTPLPSAQRMIDCFAHLENASPIGVFGVHYVLEGSNNGSKFIARAIRKSLNLTDDAGTKYLDPYGKQQVAYWKSFKTALADADFSADDIDTIIKSAKATYMAINGVADDLGAAGFSTELPTPIANSEPKAPSNSKCPFH
jgi:heme oxygenase